MVEDGSGKFTEIHLEQHVLTPGGVQVTSVGLGWGAGGRSHGHLCGLYAKTCDFSWSLLSLCMDLACCGTA